MPCSVHKIRDFEVQSSFELEIFRLRENIKNAVMLTHTAFFCELLSENIESKPTYLYAEPPFASFLYFKNFLKSS